MFKLIRTSQIVLALAILVFACSPKNDDSDEDNTTNEEKQSVPVLSAAEAFVKAGAETVADIVPDLEIFSLITAVGIDSDSPGSSANLVKNSLPPKRRPLPPKGKLPPIKRPTTPKKSASKPNTPIRQPANDKAFKERISENAKGLPAENNLYQQIARQKRNAPVTKESAKGRGKK